MTDDMLKFVALTLCVNEVLTILNSSQAYETRADLARQRSSLSGISTRMTNVLSEYRPFYPQLTSIYLVNLDTMPGINNLVSMIKSRRRRDSIILGVVIGFCIILILSYLW